jgi:hypothetical protein
MFDMIKEWGKWVVWAVVVGIAYGIAMHYVIEMFIVVGSKIAN